MEENKLTYPSFAPWDITPATFTQLLNLYPTTLKEGYKRKLVASHARRYKKHPERMNKEDPVFDKQTNEYLKMDEWRYQTIPRVLRDRDEGKEDGEKKKKKKKGTIHSKQGRSGDSLFMNKEELVQLMEWKLKHGQYRPALAGMIKTNNPEVVHKTTCDAFKALIDKTPTHDSLEETFPKKSQDILVKPLRAVGPATASLILAVATEGKKNEIPFYSDDIYWWLCLGLFPGSEKNRYNDKKAAKSMRDDGRLDVKYNMEEYRELYEEVFKLRHRLNHGDDEKDQKEEPRQFSCADVERVAYVLKNFDISGFPNAAEILEQYEATMDEARIDQNPLGKKKSRHDDDDESEERGGKRQAGFAETGRGKRKKV
ncbi:hypothetical protein TMatcc_004033 [Talaromyces marneffei ATCC 18224]|uniref:Uncharacterized protein n=1 Tax=Talaromyces marneffei (strain ATCC 18224 / CBS 334.59 / QM 7333) TaxID=441960 RepID=B6Q6Y0_TALMQ|nr:uncharacterized protein EYB26_000984 [Talaromyces marneffei]EEA27670.1 conserved hypothetical protein [Talaromyces marneffei ATCC 18224]KAE8556649.1 hypothetical protein EYB25_001352 [Talaromyces marneffei]QGA13336.1 hypothetical protein EYB26_000984 [Talaromyces marneffei]